VQLPVPVVPLARTNDEPVFSFCAVPLMPAGGEQAAWFSGNGPPALSRARLARLLSERVRGCGCS